jgi:hypothetical protein
VSAAPPPPGVYHGASNGMSVDLEVTKGKLTRFDAAAVPCTDDKGRSATYGMSASATALARIDARGHFQATLRPGKGVTVALAGTFAGSGGDARATGTLRLSGACVSATVGWTAKPKLHQ